MTQIKKYFEEATPAEFLGGLIVAAIVVRFAYEILTDK